MTEFKSAHRGQQGFSLTEFVAALTGCFILLAIAVPVVSTVTDRYRVRMVAQSIVSQLQLARMKAVSSNESFQVNFPAGQNYYEVESSTGAVVSGPFYLGRGISWNSTDPGSDVSFPGRMVIFLPTGNIPTAGTGSAGRARIMSRDGIRIDLVVSSGGVIRQTTPYSSPPAPF